MADYGNRHSINMEEVKSDLIRGLARELESLKETLKAEIQALIAERDRLMEDVEGFGRQRDDAIREAETLNMKNQQLADLNNELTQQIQNQYQTYKHRVPGLGIFDGSATTLADNHSDKRPPPSVTSGTVSSIGTPVNEQNIENPEVFVAQKVATYKNGAQQKKFFWKKPQMTKGTAGKVFNSLFASENPREGYPVDGQNNSELSVQQAQKNQAADNTNSNKLFGTQKKWGKSKPANGTSAATDISPSGKPIIFPQLYRLHI
jgi:CRISPR/Cas system CMR-associated protein Cmr5 small subunit